MIRVEVAHNLEGRLTSFTVTNHGSSFVCGAVSMLVLNTINSIETLTNQAFNCHYNEGGGYIQFSLKGRRTSKAGVLLDAMLLGLKSTQEQYPREITVLSMESDDFVAIN